MKKSSKISQNGSTAFLDDAGDIGILIKNFHWEQTSLGSIDNWPISLRTTVGTMLHSNYPMFLFWGKDNISIYNEAFIPSFGTLVNHPSALGQPGEQSWSETWLVLKPVIDDILNGKASSLNGGVNIPVFKTDAMHDVYWTFSHSAVRNDEGEVEGVLILSTETVNESLTLSNLEKSRGDLQFAVDAAEIATFDFDPSTRKFTGNERLRKWFGVSLTGIVDFELATLAIAEEDRARVNDAIAASFVYENGGGYELEYKLRNMETNEERIVMAKGKTYFDENKQPKRFNGILLDISKHIIAERKIRESEESFRILTEALPHLVWVTDAQGNKIYISKSWDEYTGFNDLEFHQWVEVVHQQDLSIITDAWTNSLQSGIAYNSEVRLKRKDGQFRWHKVEGVPLKNEQNEIVRWIGAFSDIHELRLREAQKDEFIAIASHEMKTPLTTAKGYLELLLVTIMPENSAALLYADRANQALSRLQSFIAELLDVSKINNGMINYNFEEFDMVPMLQEAVHNVQVTSKQHIISIESPNEVIIEADKLRLMQVLVNLLSNAVKYSPNAASINVSITTEADTVELCVTDQGIGMGTEHLENVFSRYYRVKEHAVHFQGLGVGLYISHEIIQRHKGKMWVESEIDKGSKFYFRLPITQSNHKQ